MPIACSFWVKTGLFSRIFPFWGKCDWENSCQVTGIAGGRRQNHFKTGWRASSRVALPDSNCLAKSALTIQLFAKFYTKLHSKLDMIYWAIFSVPAAHFKTPLVLVGLGGLILPVAAFRHKIVWGLFPTKKTPPTKLLRLACFDTP